MVENIRRAWSGFRYIIPIVILISISSAACSPLKTFTPEVLLPTSTSIDTPLPETVTLTVTITKTPIPSTPKFTKTPTETIEPTEAPTGEFTGAQISGVVELPTGEGLAGVNIYYALSSYPSGTLLGVTDSRGRYSGFISIPHEEIVRIWAELEGYQFKSGDANRAWLNGEFGWHHYGGYENALLNFIGAP